MKWVLKDGEVVDAKPKYVSPPDRVNVDRDYAVQRVVLPKSALIDVYYDVECDAWIVTKKVGFVGRKVYLELRVKVLAGWREDENALRRLGFGKNRK